jgi:hypothetical protein
MAWQRLKLEIPEEYTPSEREDFGVLVADYIRERTAKGVGVRDGSTYKFPGYSPSYVKSLDFKIAGKSKGQVNLELSGDMLAELDVLRTKPGEVVVGFEKGTEANDKAEGNILGSYGGDPNPKRARNFLGLTARELEALVRKFERERGG